ncbi:hypothetical protein T484DRAFT_1967481 [Baffinella frigidus]|nr:hypothetical protein T484DRAFT_1967481 [Cryptophyta sp. CCMP2293]
MEDRIEALKGEYVRIYLAFAEVRGWRSDAEVGALLDANTAAALERALTLALEAVGSALQATVTAHGGEWKTFRSKVVASVKAAGTPAVLFPPEDRVKLARAGAGAVVGRGAVVEAPSPTGGALGRWGRRTASPGGGDKSPPCGDQRMEIAGDVLRRAEQSMAGAMEQMERVGAGPQAHPQAHDTMAQARDTIQTLTSKVAEHRA